MRCRLRSALVLLVLPLHSACSRADADAANSRPYGVGVAERGEIRVTVEETGVVEPERQIVVKSPISGIVETLSAREGDRVRPGQSLARIVPDIAQANTFAEMKSTIAAAEIARENARREYERAQDLWRRRFGQAPSDPRERARQMRFLAGRGFDADVIRRIVSSGSLRDTEA